MPPEADDDDKKNRANERAEIRAEDRQERRDVRAEQVVSRRADDLLDAERRREDPLIQQLEKVQDSLMFRRWTRRRIIFLILFVVVDILTSVVSISALVLVTRQAKEQCVASNQLRQAERELWNGVITRSPIPPLGDDATPDEINAHNERVKQTVDFQTDLRLKFAEKDC